MNSLRTPFLCTAVLLAACGTDSGSSGGVETGAVLCDNGFDDDSDGFTDCADQDCWGFGACTSGPDGGGDTGGDTNTPDATTDPDGTPVIDTMDVNRPDAIACDPCADKGSVKGRVCAPNENVFVNDAEVWIEGVGCGGETFKIETTSGPDGTYYLLDVPCGTHTLEMQAGSFGATFPVQVRQGQLLDVTGAATKLCFGATAVKIAVLGGTWDDLGGLVEQLGFRFDYFNDDGDEGADGAIVDLLSDRTRLFGYDIVFAECGGTAGWLPQDEPAVMPNVKDFVLQGGSLYMSDYAWVLGEWSFPDKVTWFNSDDPSSMGAGSGNSPQVIPSGTRVTATVVDGALAGYLGKTQIPIEFDSGPQVAPVSVANGAFAHVTGNIVIPLGPNIPNAPLALSYVPAQGAGRVMYTNFHNDAQTTSDMLTILQYLVFRL